MLPRMLLILGMDFDLQCSHLPRCAGNVSQCTQPDSEQGPPPTSMHPKCKYKGIGNAPHESGNRTTVSTRKVAGRVGTFAIPQKVLQLRFRMQARYSRYIKEW